MSYHWRRPATVFVVCPVCWCRKAETITGDYVRCLGRVWNDDTGRFGRCTEGRYL
jgi:hypothetical protein